MYHIASLVLQYIGTWYPMSFLSGTDFLSTEVPSASMMCIFLRWLATSVKVVPSCMWNIHKHNLGVLPFSYYVSLSPTYSKLRVCSVKQKALDNIHSIILCSKENCSPFCLLYRIKQFYASIIMIKSIHPLLANSLSSLYPPLKHLLCRSSHVFP